MKKTSTLTDEKQFVADPFNVYSLHPAGYVAVMVFVCWFDCEQVLFQSTETDMETGVYKILKLKWSKHETLYKLRT